MYPPNRGYGLLTINLHMNLLKLYAAVLTAAALFFGIKRIWWQKTQNGNVPGDYWNARAEIFRAFPPDTCKVVFAGDSHIEYSPFATVFPGSAVRGIEGETLAMLLRRLPCLLHCRPKVLVVNSGINDIDQGRTDIEQNFDSLIRACRPTRLILMEIMPVAPRYPNAGKVNREVDSIDRWLRMRGARKVIHAFDRIDNTDTWDGIHLRAEAYEKWADAIRPALGGM